MKYIIICLSALIICFGIGFLFANLIMKKTKKTKKGAGISVLTIAFGIIIMISTTLGYMSVYYHAEDAAISAMEKSEAVKIQKIDGGYFFDGEGSDTALIFYPGAKVECESYTKLMIMLSENGIDCFLADMPFNFAIFGAQKADLFINAYKYDKWIMAGHSMGGLVASNYSAEHSDIIDGLVLLAAYPTGKVNDSIKMISVYGSNDNCLNIEEYQKDKANWSENSEELILEGGNHSQFADYGEQKGDGKAAITAEEQQKATEEAIISFWRN